MCFSLCFLHATVIERKKYGPMGWCLPYEFNDHDLVASLGFIEKYFKSLTQQGLNQTADLGIDSKMIIYMVAEVQYGSRTTDDLDRELFSVYAQEYLKEALSEHCLADTPNFKYKTPSRQCTKIE